MQPGQHYLKKNKVVMEKGSPLKPADVSAYVRKDKIYDTSLVVATKENIIGHLQYIGYYGSTVDSEVKFRRKKADVTYTVHPGRRLVIDSMTFNVPDDSVFRREFERDSSRVSIHPGDFLGEKDLLAEAERSAQYYRNRGYYGFNKLNYAFVADTVTTPGKLLLDYRIQDIPEKYTIGNINVSYPSSLKFRDKIFNGLIPLHSGDSYSDRRINTVYSRLSRLTLFNGVNVSLTPRDSVPVVDCEINLTPARMQGVKLNLEASVNSSGLLGISPQINYYHNNIFHGGERFTLGFSGNFQFRFSDKASSNEFGVALGLSLPKFLGISYENFRGSNIPSTEFKASFNYQNRPEYKKDILSFTYGYTGSLGSRGNFFSYQFFPLRINTVRLFDMSEDFLWVIIHNPMLYYSYSDHLNAGVSGNIYWSDNPSAMPKTTFRYIRANLSLSGNVLSLLNGILPMEYGEHTIFGLPYSQYAKLDVSAGYTWRFGDMDQFALASRITGGICRPYGNSTWMPFEEQFFCGGANSMRAWQARTLGPGGSKPSTAFVIPSQIGDMRLEADLEFRFPMFWKLEGAVFAETGNIWNLKTEDSNEDDPSLYFSFKTLAFDWGAGIRLNFDFLLVRLDLAFKTHDPSRDEGSRWLRPVEWLNKNNFCLQFGVGYPF